MRYILDSRIALRSWQQVPYAYYRKGSPYAKGLKKEEFELLRSCDGKREQEADDLLETMAARGFIHPCREQDTLLQSGQSSESEDAQQSDHLPGSGT